MVECGLVWQVFVEVVAIRLRLQYKKMNFSRNRWSWNQILSKARSDSLHLLESAFLKIIQSCGSCFNPLLKK